MSGERVTMAIPSLINGISQQAQGFRLSSQAELQVNALSSVLDGLSKRPPTEHIAKITGDSLDNAFIHTINRDSEERYVVVVYGGKLRVFDLLNNGKEMEVNCPDGTDYIDAARPGDALRMTTVADYTFIVNRTVEVGMDETEEREKEVYEAIAFVKKGIIDTTYKLMVDGVWFDYTTPSPSSLVTSTTSGGEPIEVNTEGWTWTQCYNWLRNNNVEIPSGLNPNTWTRQECYYFWWRVESNGGKTEREFIIQQLNRSDADIQSSKLNPEVKQDLLDIKANMRELVRISSLSSEATISISTSENSNTQPSTDDIAKYLAMGIEVEFEDEYIIDVIGSSLRIRRADGEDFTFAVSDSWGNEALMGIKKEVQKYQDLPARAWDGFRVRVVGENPTRDDDYYLEYSSDSFYKNGVWKETRGWDQWNRFDPATMPHILIREADGTFTFKRATWRERKCGDDYSVPWPSFVEGRIEDVFFYRNRLGFIVDENVVLSQAAGYFNFWPDTATAVLATDPIDIAVTNDKVSLLRFASVFGESLILFADQAQFQLTSGGQPNLAPDTVKVDKTTEYWCSTACKPVHSGQSLYFVAERGDYSGLREYTVSSDSVSADAPEITSHVPNYLPKGINRMAVAINDGTLFAISRERPNTVYVYRFFWVGDEKLQSSWSHWDLHTDATVLSIAAIDSSLYLMVQYPDGTYLERLDPNADGEEIEMGHKVFLDRKVRLWGVYSASTDTTAWTLPYEAQADALTLLVTPGHSDEPSGTKIPGLANSSPATVQAKGDFSQSAVIAGIHYEMRYRFSQQFMRESKEPGASVIQAGRLQLLAFSLTYKDSGYFHTEVTSRGRPVKIKAHRGTIGSLASRMDKPLLESGQFRFMVLARSDRVTIDIVNDSHYPSCFQAAEWEGTHTTDAKRM